jgi:hypothetical protein
MSIVKLKLPTVGGTGRREHVKAGSDFGQSQWHRLAGTDLVSTHTGERNTLTEGHPNAAPSFFDLARLHRR